MSADIPQVRIGTIDGGLYLHVDGRATQRVCPTADKLVGDYLAARPERPSVAIDLEGCEWMDSTFAGWMTSLHKRLAREGGGRVILTNCTDRCQSSLGRMHLDALFSVETLPAPAETREIACTTTDRPSKQDIQLMLRAHEELASINEANSQVFMPIVEMLRKQLKQT